MISKTPHYRSKLQIPSTVSDKFAYFLGVLLGDGSVGTPERPTIYIVGNLVDERGFYDHMLIPLITELFSIHPYRYVRKGKNAYAVHFKSRRLVEYLVSEVGFPGSQGPKFLPSTIRSLGDHGKCSFIRGLFDSDGSLIFSKKTYQRSQYPTIEIKTVSHHLGRSVKDLLVAIGFRAALNRSAESWVVRLNGLTMLEMWMNKIGSRNVKHLTKYLVWKKDGFCPPETTTPMRLKLLGIES
jgi:hypothetical protein